MTIDASFDTKPTPPTEYTLLSGQDMANQTPPKWLIKNTIPEVGLSAVYGPPGVGKTFVTLSMALHVAAGFAWFGYRVKQKPVVYLALEGALNNRLTAWSKSGGEIPANFRAIQGQGFCFKEDSDLDGLIKAVQAFAPKGGFIVVDTLARASAGADENSARDMGEIVQAADRLYRETNSCVLLVHHSGKDDSRGMRGSNSLPGAVLSILKVAKGIITIERNKEGIEGEQLPFALEIVEVSKDEDGDPVTSCWAHRVIDDEGKPKGSNQVQLLDILTKALEQAKTGVAYAPAGVKALTDKEVRAIAKVHGIDRRRVSEALEPLLRRGTFATGGPVPPQPGTLGRALWLP